MVHLDLYTSGPLPAFISSLADPDLTYCNCETNDIAIGLMAEASGYLAVWERDTSRLCPKCAWTFPHNTKSA